MREIKFRAWDKERKCFLNNIDFASDVNPTRDSDKTIQLRYRDAFELMQYTGLKDKNGKEINEGDILEIDEEGRKMFDAAGSDGSGVAKRQIVSFKDGSWMTGRSPLDLYHENTYLWILLPSCEVIGNIYENPELLKSV